MKNKYFSSLQGQLSLSLFLSFLAVGVLAVVIILCSIRAFQHEATQVMHQGLATYVVKDYLKIEQGVPDLEVARETFRQLMFLGKNFEFYILDPNGKILSYSVSDPSEIKRTAVDLAAISSYLNTDISARPIYGNDPRSANGDKIFSVAPILKEGELCGYLYVILGSQIYDQVADSLWGSIVLQWGVSILIAGFAFALLATLLLTGIITRPLRQLIQQVSLVQATGLSKAPAENQHLMQSFEQWRSDDEHEMHQLGSAFRQLIDKLNQQYQQVVTIDDLRKELLSHVSHDLRTPLASMLGYLETWQLNHENMTEEESRECIATAKKNAQRISVLIEQLFELAHLDSTSVQVNKESFPIAELVQDVLQKFSIQAQARGIHLDVEPKDSSIHVVGDIEKLDRVFTNLIENALRHSKDQGTIRVKLFDQSSLVSIQVEDTGIGIPSKDLPHIFDPHYKAENSVRENTAHGGLGLAITKKILDLHQSRINVKSRLDEGTTFVFSLPKGI